MFRRKETIYYAAVSLVEKSDDICGENFGVLTVGI
jgi:hypothetical protein